ncbi:MAG: hypothetical protein WDZ69_03090 [Candidatus Pacearchaeota archaeon]
MIRGVLKKSKRGIIADYLPWILIAVAVLAILMITIFILRERGVSLIDKVGDILR